MVLKIATVLSLLISLRMYWWMGAASPWARWTMTASLLVLLAASILDAAWFHRQTRTLEAKGWRLTFLDRAISLGARSSWTLGYIPRRDDCLALPGYDAGKPDIENIMKFLRENPKGK